MIVNFTRPAVSFTALTNKDNKDNTETKNIQNQTPASNKEFLLTAGIVGLAIVNSALLISNLKSQKASSEKFDNLQTISMNF